MRPSFHESRPITRPSRRLRGILVISFLAAAFILGGIISTIAYRTNRDYFRSSDMIGAMLCGDGHHISDVPAKKKSIRMICVAPDGREIADPYGLIGLRMALPLFLLFAVPAIWIALAIDIRLRRV